MLAQALLLPIFGSLAAAGSWSLLSLEASSNTNMTVNLVFSGPVGDRNISSVNCSLSFPVNTKTVSPPVDNYTDCANPLFKIKYDPVVLEPNEFDGIGGFTLDLLQVSDTGSNPNQTRTGSVRIRNSRSNTPGANYNCGDPGRPGPCKLLSAITVPYNTTESKSFVA